MQRQSIETEKFRSIGYDSENLILEIEFHDGSVYQYRTVPEGIHCSLMETPYKEIYFLQNIKNHYFSEKL